MWLWGLIELMELEQYRMVFFVSKLRFLLCKMWLNGECDTYFDFFIELYKCWTGFVRAACNDVKTHAARFSVNYAHNHFSVWVETTTCDWPWPNSDHLTEAAPNFKEGRSCKREGKKPFSFSVIHASWTFCLFG